VLLSYFTIFSTPVGSIPKVYKIEIGSGDSKSNKNSKGGEAYLCGPNKSFLSYGMCFLSVEEEIKMLEGAKENLEHQLGNVNNRLEKLKA
jgi:hypothetical protein